MQGQDLSSGNLTAPAIFALEESSELRDIIENEFTEDGSLERALVLVKQCGGVERAMELAREEGEKVRMNSLVPNSLSSPHRKYHYHPFVCLASPCRSQLMWSAYKKRITFQNNRDVLKSVSFQARAALSCLPESPSKDALELMIDYSLQRLA